MRAKKKELTWRSFQVNFKVNGLHSRGKATFGFMGHPALYGV